MHASRVTRMHFPQGNNQGRTQVAYNARYPMPATKSGSSSNLY